MILLRRPSIAMFLPALSFLLVSVSAAILPDNIIISSIEEIKEDFSSVPCKEADRLNATKALFQKMGASSSEMSIEKYKNVENLMIRKQGTSEQKIVIGAHYDKVSDGCGALDNWTGIVALAHLYKSLKNYPLKKTVPIIAFGKEEKGLIGSRAFVDSIKKEELGQYCAMINIDSLGLGAAQVADNMSSKKLGELAEGLAKEMKMPFGHARIEGAGSDSNAFLLKKIPALTIHGMTNEWPKILHSSNDQVSKVNAGSVYLGYRLAFALLSRIDETSCDAYR